MIDRTPMMNGMSVKQMAKHYDSLSAPRQPETAPMKKRQSGYVGMPLEKQSEDHKAPTMTKRAKSYKAKAERESRPYAVNNQFTLRIGGDEIKCSRISNLSMAREIEEVVEGGNDGSPNFFAGASKKADVLVIERALVEDSVAAKFKPGVYVGAGTISFFRDGKNYKALGFDSGMITKCELSNLDALGSEVMIQKIEIVHTGLHDVPVQ